jgi:hypothetical protein
MNSSCCIFQAEIYHYVYNKKDWNNSTSIWNTSYATLPLIKREREWESEGWKTKKNFDIRACGLFSLSFLSSKFLEQPGVFSLFQIMHCYSVRRNSTCLLSPIKNCKGGGGGGGRGTYTILFLMFDLTSYCNKMLKWDIYSALFFLLWTRARAGFPYKYPGKHCSFEAHQEIPKTYFCASVMSKIT